jgi:FkbM family methyltransferase
MKSSRKSPNHLQNRWMRLRYSLLERFPEARQWYRSYKTKSLAKVFRSSYSQHGEDVLVEQWLSGYDLSQGIYVDVGANHPISISNTYLFYKNGHHGIVIEPNQSLLVLHKMLRTRDIHLGIGCGETLSIKKFQIARSHEVSSFVPNYQGKDISFTEYLPVVTLNFIHQSLSYHYEFVFFMSIDVEGYDYEVLIGGEEMLSKTLFLCIEANDKESEEKIIKRLECLNFNLLKKLKVNLLFKNSSEHFNKFYNI